MTLLAPNAGWLLLLLPLIILLYFLKLRHPRHRVPSTLLWHRMLQDSRVNTPFQRLKRSLLLLLQVAALTALAFAAARPLQLLQTKPQESVLVLLDRSASMQAVVGDGSRFAAARRQLSRLIDDLGPRSEMAIATYAERPTIIQTFTSDHRRLARVANRLAPSDAPDNPAAALELASSLVVARPTTRVILISDTLPASPGAQLPFELEFIRVGSPAANLAITGAQARRRPDSPTTVELHLLVRRFGDLPAPLIRIMRDERQLAARVPSFDANHFAALSFSLDLADAAVIEVRLEASDALAVDNRAWVAVPPPDLLRIAVEGPEATTRFFETAIAALPFAESAASDPAASLRTVATLPVEPPRAHELLVLTPTIEAPAGIVDWQSDAPLLRFVNLSDLRIARLATVDFPESYRILATIGNHPLIAEQRNGRYLRTVLAFPPEQSNWPLLPSFPLFLHNWTNQLSRLSPNAAVADLRVGRRRAIAPAPPGSPVRIDGPAESPRATTVGGLVFASGLDRAGVYRVNVAERETFPIAVNLFDANESDLQRQTTTTITQTPPVTTIPPRVPASREWTTLVAAVALLILVMEWAVYHRLRFRSAAPAPSEATL